MQRYRIDKDGSSFNLFEENTFLCSFTRETFRETLENLCRSSHWIGYILRLLNKQYPNQSLKPLKDTAEGYGIGYLIDYMQSKGYRVFIPLPLSDLDIACYLMSHGYEVTYPDKDEKEGNKKYGAEISTS